MSATGGKRTSQACRYQHAYEPRVGSRSEQTDEGLYEHFGPAFVRGDLEACHVSQSEKKGCDQKSTPVIRKRNPEQKH